MTSPQMKRRTMLRAGAAVLTLPWLESLAHAADAAAKSGPPKRLVAICHAFGLYGPSFFPEKAGRDYAASEYLAVLGDLPEQCTVFSGISHPEIGGDHASESCFLTSAKHPTAGGFRNRRGAEDAEAIDPWFSSAFSAPSAVKLLFLLSPFLASTP